MQWLEVDGSKDYFLRLRIAIEDGRGVRTFRVVLRPPKSPSQFLQEQKRWKLGRKTGGGVRGKREGADVHHSTTTQCKAWQSLAAIRKG